MWMSQQRSQSTPQRLTGSGLSSAGQTVSEREGPLPVGEGVGQVAVSEGEGRRSRGKWGVASGRIFLRKWAASSEAVRTAAGPISAWQRGTGVGQVAARASINTNLNCACVQSLVNTTWLAASVCAAHCACRSGSLTGSSVRLTQVVPPS
jgi:hypothetical protein